jgi:hypothetical protein
MITSWIKIVRFASSTDRSTTNMQDAAQAQEALVLSLQLSAFGVPSGAKPGSTEASGRLEDVRRLLDISTSSKSEDMRGIIQGWFSSINASADSYPPRAAAGYVMGRVVTRHKYRSHHMKQIQMQQIQRKEGVAGQQC